MEPVVSKEQAEEEITKFLDNLDVDPEKRKDFSVAAVIAKMIKDVSKGHLIFNEDGSITQKLIEPLGEKGITSEIKYTNRYRIGDFHKKMKKVAHGDTIGSMIAKLSLLSGEDEAVFEKFIKQDWEVAANVTVFF